MTGILDWWNESMRLGGFKVHQYKRLLAGAIYNDIWLLAAYIEHAVFIRLRLQYACMLDLEHKQLPVLISCLHAWWCIFQIVEHVYHLCIWRWTVHQVLAAIHFVLVGSWLITNQVWKTCTLPHIETWTVVEDFLRELVAEHIYIFLDQMALFRRGLESNVSHKLLWLVFGQKVSTVFTLIGWIWLWILHVRYFVYIVDC